jgi:hypothetical protein
MTLTIEMPSNLEEKLAEEARRVGASVSDYIVQVLTDIVDAPNTWPATEAHPVLRLAERVRASIPKAEWDRLPRDLAENSHHYLYGEREESE